MTVDGFSMGSGLPFSRARADAAQPQRRTSRRTPSLSLSFAGGRERERDSREQALPPFGGGEFKPDARVVLGLEEEGLAAHDRLGRLHEDRLHREARHAPRRCLSAPAAPPDARYSSAFETPKKDAARRTRPRRHPSPPRRACGSEPLDLFFRASSLAYSSRAGRTHTPVRSTSSSAAARAVALAACSARTRRTSFKTYDIKIRVCETRERLRGKMRFDSFPHKSVFFLPRLFVSSFSCALLLRDTSKFRSWYGPRVFPKVSLASDADLSLGSPSAACKDARDSGALATIRSIYAASVLRHFTDFFRRTHERVQRLSLQPGCKKRVCWIAVAGRRRIYRTGCWFAGTPSFSIASPLRCCRTWGHSAPKKPP